MSPARHTRSSTSTNIPRSPVGGRGGGRPAPVVARPDRRAAGRRTATGVALALSAATVIALTPGASQAADGPSGLHPVAVSGPGRSAGPPADDGPGPVGSSVRPPSFRAPSDDVPIPDVPVPDVPVPDVPVPGGADPSDPGATDDPPTRGGPADEPDDPRADEPGDDTGGLLVEPLEDLVAVGERLLFSEEFGDDLSSFVNLQTRDRNNDPGDYCTYSACVVRDDPDRPDAVRFEVRPGDVPDFGGGERTEVRFPSSADVEEGDERFYEFDLKFEDYPPPEGINGGSHSIVMQWHPGDVGPVFHLGVDGTGNFIVGHRWSEDKKVIGPIDEGRWHSYVVHVKHSRSSGSGFLEIWRDGELVVPRHSRATMDSSSSYLKMGIYRGEESFNQSLLYDNVRITAP